MYQILIDGGDLYYPGDEEYTVSDAVVNLQLNDSGSVEFNLPVTNPEYANIKNRISMIQVLKDVGVKRVCKNYLISYIVP